MKGRERDSNFELLRLVSMYFIVIYHLLMWLVLDDSSSGVMKSFWLPLHVGVVCFVLLSGFFQIHPSIKGLIRLLGVFMLLSLPEIIYGCSTAENWRDVLNSLLFITHSHYWFVRTYLGLYLISPLINKYLSYSSHRERWYLLFVCIVISVYFGLVSKSSIYNDGKNIINFLLIYQIGHLLNEYKNKWERVSIWVYVIVYLFLNVTLVVLYWTLRDTYWESVIWRFSFPYNSPILIINAVILFLIFGKLRFRSMIVNRIARGCLAIYIIHGCTPMVSNLEREIVSLLYHSTSSVSFFLFKVSCLALVIMGLSFVVYLLLSPVWILLERVGVLAQEKIRFL